MAPPQSHNTPIPRCYRRLHDVRRRASILASVLLAAFGLWAFPVHLQTTAAPAPDTDRMALREIIAASIAGRPFPTATLGEPLRRWVDANAGALEGLRPGGLREQPWGLSALHPGGDGQPSLLYLYVFDWHASGQLVVYGLTGGVGRARLLNDADNKALPLEYRGRNMLIDAPKQSPDPLATVVVLELQGKLQTQPLALNPAPDGRIVLHARDAIVHGRTVRYEPDPHKDTVGYWTDAGDWVSWQLEVTTPGRYGVEILQGCGKGSGGSDVEFAVDEKQPLKVTVQDTGGFQNFVDRRIGEFRFDRPGSYTLSAKPIRKPGLAVMDLRQVTLTPVAKK